MVARTSVTKKADVPSDLQGELKTHLLTIERKLDSLALTVEGNLSTLKPVGLNGAPKAPDEGGGGRERLPPLIEVPPVRAPSPYRTTRPAPVSEPEELQVERAWQTSAAPFPLSLEPSGFSLPGSFPDEEPPDDARVPSPLRNLANNQEKDEPCGPPVPTAGKGKYAFPTDGEHDSRRANAPVRRRTFVDERERRSSLVSDEHLRFGRLRSFLKLSTNENSSGDSLKETLAGRLGITRMLTAPTHTALENAEQSWLWRSVHGQCFQTVCSVVIAANVVTIGITAHVQVRSVLAREPEHPVWEQLDFAFVAFFAVELLLRLASEGRFFVLGPEWKWNVFDSILVVLSFCDVILNGSHGIFGQNTSASPSFSAGRILRFVRVVRVIRIVRAVKPYASLRIMVHAILECMVSLIWCFILVFLIVYVWAILFLYGVTEHFRDPEKLPTANETLLEFYNGVLRAMVTLFATISGGVDWKDAMQPLTEISWLYEPVFNAYVFFMVIGVLNVVVGSFVAAVAEISARDREFLVKNEISQLQAYTRKVKTFFREADKDKSGNLSWEEFKEYLKTPKVLAYFNSLELDQSQAHVVFKMLDWDDSGEVGLDEFLQGCMRLKGPAKSLDVNMLLYEHKRMCHKLTDFMDAFKMQMDYNSEDMDALCSHVGSEDSSWRKRPVGTLV